MKNNNYCAEKISLWNITSSYHHYFFFSCVLGEVLGFENLVFSVFEFICGLTETPKCKKTVKKFLDELIYFQVLYMQITEEQVGFVFHFYFQPIISSLFCTHIPNNRWLINTCHIDQTKPFLLLFASFKASVDIQSKSICWRWGWWHLFVFCSHCSSRCSLGKWMEQLQHSIHTFSLSVHTVFLWGSLIMLQLADCV